MVKHYIQGGAPQLYLSWHIYIYSIYIYITPIAWDYGRYVYTYGWLQTNS